MRLATTLFVFLTIFLTSGCACREKCIVYVPQKCTVPDTEEPIIDNKHYEDNASIVKKALNNYTKMKEYAEKLKANSEVCK